MFSIFSHKGHSNQNDIETPSRTEWDHQEIRQQQMLVRMWGKETIIHCWQSLSSHMEISIEGTQATKSKSTI
jgi:hypothetical protein